VRTLAYGDEPEQTGDLYLPDGPGPFRVVVLWHGGSFETRYTRAMLAPLSAELARRGLAAYNATYRRLGSGGGVPATFDDALAAVDLLAGIDAPLDLSSPPAGIGLSAGAPLALHAALEGRLSRVIDIAGVSLLTEVVRAVGERASARRLFRAGPDEAPERYAAFDPGARGPLPVPALILHGTDDDVVPLAVSEEYARRAGPLCSLIPVAGAGHFDLYGRDCAAPDELFSFLGVG
jgi:acetyl esterase/lipase